MAETHTSTAQPGDANVGKTTLGEIVQRLCDLTVAGRQMRLAQKQYFKTRSRTAMLSAITLEKLFDGLLELEP